jgi:hypothetical protein
MVWLAGWEVMDGGVHGGGRTIISSLNVVPYVSLTLKTTVVWEDTCFVGHVKKPPDPKLIVTVEGADTTEGFEFVTASVSEHAKGTFASREIKGETGLPPTTVKPTLKALSRGAGGQPPG